MSAPRRGFSLLEVVIAFAIIGLTATATSGLLSRASLYTRSVTYQNMALNAIRYEVETLRAGGYAALPGSGLFTNALVTAIPSALGELTVSDFTATTKKVVVIVSWTISGHALNAQLPSSGPDTVSLSITTLITKDSALL